MRGDLPVTRQPAKPAEPPEAANRWQEKIFPTVHYLVQEVERNLCRFPQSAAKFLEILQKELYLQRDSLLISKTAHY